MPERENNPDQKLDGLLQGYEERLEQTLSSELEELENLDLWKNIESQLENDAKAFAVNENTQEFDEAFLCAYADGEAPLDDPEVIAFEKELAHSPLALQQIADMQSLSSLIKSYGQRAEEACTVDFTASIMNEIQTTATINAENNPDTIISIQSKSGQDKKTWLAIPLAAAAAIAFLIFAGNPFGDSQLASQKSADTSHTLAFVQSSKQNNPALSPLQETEATSALDEIQGAGSVAILNEADDSKLVSSKEDQDGTQGFDGFMDNDLGNTSAVSRLGGRNKNRRDTNENRETKVSYASIAENIEANKKAEKPKAPQDSFRYLARGNAEKLLRSQVLADAESFEAESLGLDKNLAPAKKSLLKSKEKTQKRQRFTLASGAFNKKDDRSPQPSSIAPSYSEPSGLAVGLGGSERYIPTAENYMMMYCNETLPKQQTDSTSFMMQTCTTGI